VKIKIAKSAGFCPGVKRAMIMVEKALRENKQPVCILGELIHNSQVVARLEKNGLKTVKSLNEVPKKALFVIRSHGITPQLIKEIKSKGIKILDTTCPFVKNAQMVAEKFYKKGLQVIICGERQHAEVVGINARTKNSGIVVQDVAELKKIDLKKKDLGVLSQTTQNIELLKKVVITLLEQVKNLVIENTICLDSSNKRSEALSLASKVNCMVVVGGKHSSNTKRLAEVCRGIVKTHHIETAQELKKNWFKGVKKVGLTAGASTPDWIIKEVKQWLELA
jgi:4-hydroxy-3-methylbut-2-enyl diphosphate reductase